MEVAAGSEGRVRNRKDELAAFLLGLILGKGTLDRDERKLTIGLRYGHYANGRIQGGGVGFDEHAALPAGARQVCARLERLVGMYDSLDRVRLESPSIYRHDIVLEFASEADLFETIVSWYPVGSGPATFSFPRAKLSAASIPFARAFMQGYTCATGLITDHTRAGTTGRHRVYVRAPAANKGILEEIRWLLEEKLNIPVVHIHWHEGRDPQLRVYADNFEEVGFGLDWEDQILAACAEENRGKWLIPRDQLRLFD